MGYGREGKRIRLAPLDKEKHLANCVRWFNDTRVTDTLAMGSFPMTKAMEEKFFDDMVAGSTRDVVMAIEMLESGQHIGMSGIHGIDWIARIAKTGSVIGEPEYWGQGIGTEQSRVRARYAFEILNLGALYSEFVEGNDASRKMQVKSGYEIWGAKPRAHYRGGQYRDLIQTVLFRERWLELQGHWGV